ncbi:hypothetical protein TH66_00215 [Carbonactinospora thermoautotrophica]|uniref:Uncharacterized protein n=1 Tax=Carbonactinospora thermoautotrophica TaxID=1469144 RepID=A0A132N399_9ACTN|nr:hypothetical protein [Carbonactinospora thermoautotrophica]KWX04625.1 hypothetical protein TR74_24180 [Carbonactinospora thermoautotrophica]KWX05975.1 hypothetical protein TH66_00215 [Carbonactinospora thermoautotrophica]
MTVLLFASVLATAGFVWELYRRDGQRAHWRIERDQAGPWCDGSGGRFPDYLPSWLTGGGR